MSAFVLQSYWPGQVDPVNFFLIYFDRKFCCCFSFYARMLEVPENLVEAGTRPLRRGVADP